MKTKENLVEKKENFKSYVAQINWDWWIFRGLSILGGILFIALIVYLLWIRG